MKIVKLFFVSAICSLVMLANAAVTQQATFQLIAPEYDFNKSLTITADDAVTGDFATGSATQPANPAGDRYVNIYVLNNTTKYGAVVRKDINGLQFTAEANKKETAYKMVFSNVIGEFSISDGTNVYDVVDGDTIDLTMTTGGSIAFTVVVPQGYPREIATGNWGTFCYPEAISSVTGAEVYSFVGKDETKVYGVQVTTFPLVKGQAYLFKATADAQSFNYTDATTAPASANNGLVGTFAEYTTTTGDEAAYVVKGTSLVPAALGSTVPANRAYVQKLSDIQGGAPAPGRKYVAFSINNPTAIEAVQAAGMKEGKMIVNGQFVIVKDGKMFNAQGAAL